LSSRFGKICQLLKQSETYIIWYKQECSRCWFIEVCSFNIPCTGNNTFKVIQHNAFALAIGQVLQGLNKPVNDLSRGCLVKDIVNTVVITAIQAQGVKK